MTDLTAAIPPFILQPAFREPGYLDKIERQIAYFDGVLDENQIAALRRALTKRNRPDQDVLNMVAFWTG